MDTTINYKSSKKQSYVSQFLSLKCAGDVLNIVNPLGSGAEKEISESMGIIKHLRDIVLTNPGKYKIYDICAGNALTSITACHLLPIRGAAAIDILHRDRQWDKVKNFEYKFEDIFSLSSDFIEEDSIIIGVHACRKLAKRIVDLYKQSKAKYLILMPCCEGGLSGQYQLICDKLGKSLTWCLELAIMCDGKMYEDNHILSPKNIIIVAEKLEK
jgi:hypothetical protein